MATCGINNGITATCADLRRIGGLNKRVWIYDVDGVTYSESGGYVTGITFPTYGGLYKFESVKKSHQAGWTASVQSGANKFFQHDVVLKLFATTPTDDEVIEDLLVASVGIIIETNNKEFIIYGKDNGMDMTAGTQNSGTESASDTTDILTFMGEEKYKPKRFQNVDYATGLALLESYEL